MSSQLLHHLVTVTNSLEAEVEARHPFDMRAIFYSEQEKFEQAMAPVRAARAAIAEARAAAASVAADNDSSRG